MPWLISENAESWQTQKTLLSSFGLCLGGKGELCSRRYKQVRRQQDNVGVRPWPFVSRVREDAERSDLVPANTKA